MKGKGASELDDVDVGSNGDGRLPGHSELETAEAPLNMFILRKTPALPMTSSCLLILRELGLAIFALITMLLLA